MMMTKPTDECDEEAQQDQKAQRATKQPANYAMLDNSSTR